MVIFAIALVFRFYSFRESVYFSFDQARDIYISENIYREKDLKVIGPPVSGNVGLYHGVLFWYLLGPISLILGSDPALISAVFRILNSLGIFLIFLISKNMFNTKVALLAAFLFAISFEETQYSMYTGNPSLGVLAIMLIFFGASLLLKKKSRREWSSWLMLVGAACATQLNIMYAYTFLLVLMILFLFKKEILKIDWKYHLVAIGSAGLMLSSYLISEIERGFASLKQGVILVSQGYGILNQGESKYILYLGKYFRMFKDNLLGMSGSNYLVAGVSILMTLWLFLNLKKGKNYILLAIWSWAWGLLMIFGGHLAYYTNAGIGVGILILGAIFLEKIFEKNKIATLGLLALIILGNIKQIVAQAPKSLLVDFAPQAMMRLTDEYKVIDEMYTQAKGEGFTVRLTGIPYKVQTTWSHLFHNYGLKKYGYLPFWETGNTLGFPGELPVPKSGSTCVRFRVVEPTRGIPDSLIEDDIKTENLFSSVVEKKYFGDFLLESRKAKNRDCHDLRP